MAGWGLQMGIEAGRWRFNPSPCEGEVARRAGDVGTSGEPTSPGPSFARRGIAGRTKHQIIKTLIQLP
jgi:hypothetical protein